MSHEMHRLDDVAESLRKDLDEQNVDTMKTTINKLKRAGSPLLRYKYNKETILVQPSPPKPKKKEEDPWDWTTIVILPVLFLVAFRILFCPSHSVMFG